MTPVEVGSDHLTFWSAQSLLTDHLSDEQWAAIRLYKNDIAPDGSDHPGYFDRFNLALPDGTAAVPWQEYVTENLDRACELFVLNEPIVLWRGLGLSDAACAELELIGSGHIQASYSSCATEEYVAQRFAKRHPALGGAGVLLELRVPAGLNILPITPQKGQANDLESEWLLPRRYTFRIEVPAEVCSVRNLRLLKMSVSAHAAAFAKS